MQHKIRETKANLLALNDEQLQTTTRLTILQNHQLTTELEFQSKQTEKLLNKNNKMKEQIGVLKRDIGLHKEIESELAKRSHKCQKMIRNYNEQVKELEHEPAALKPKSSPYGKKGPTVHEEEGGVSKDHEGLVNMLENKLEVIENKLAQTQAVSNSSTSKTNRIE